MTMKRMAMVIGIAPDRIDEYKRLHAEVWPQVLARIAASHIHNYSIFLREPERLLFGYWEYAGCDFEADTQALAAPGNAALVGFVCTVPGAAAFAAGRRTLGLAGAGVSHRLNHE